jgi:hypothetical protein
VTTLSFNLARVASLVVLSVTLHCVSVAVSTAVAADGPPWEIAPYRVSVTLAIDDAARPQPRLSDDLIRGVEQRIASALRPLWQTTLTLAPNAQQRRFTFEPQPLPWNELTPEQRAFDKLLWLAVEANATGYRLTCREFDAYTRRWGPTLRRDVAQSAILAEAAFRLLTDAFTPLARVQAPDDEGKSRLVMKGGALPRGEGPDLLVAPGDVYLPLLRRTGRGGELVENGIVGIPWTYLVTTEPVRSGWDSQVESALRGALSGRRRGAIEQIAISLRGAPEPLRVRFFARSNRDQPLIGYEVFRLPAPKAAPELIGLTDRNGEIVVPVGESPVSTLLLRSDGQVLAKLLVAPGTAPTIDAPIADDAIRLAAQGEVQAVREELIDVVARRAILVARVQSHLKKGEGAQARALMEELTDLPTPSTFVRRMDVVHDRLPVSDDPRVRQAVDGLFTATRDLLGRFLDSRTITNLQAEVNAAGGG